MGLEHFKKLEAEVAALKIIDRRSADDVQYESILENADLIYFSGGDPGYLYETMKDTCAWFAAQRAWSRGAIYAGCSAGAMILGKRMPSFRLAGTQEGFGIVPAEFIMPHFDAIPAIWKPMILALQKQLKGGQRMIGVDEDTALVGSLNGEWKAMGKSSVQIFTRDQKNKYQSGDVVLLT
jgi:cyanophycinase